MSEKIVSYADLQSNLTEVEENLMKTLADNVVIIDEWITLDNKYKAGEITSEELAAGYSRFLLPAAYQAMLLLSTGEALLRPYMVNSRNELDKLRDEMVG